MERKHTTLYEDFGSKFANGENAQQLGLYVSVNFTN